MSLTYEASSLGAGSYRITLPLPIPSPPAVNCYLFEGNSGLTLLDCGVEGEPFLVLLSSALESLGFRLEELDRLIASHLHVDHMGLAKRIVEATGCEWVMHTSVKSEIPHYNDWGPRWDELARIVEESGAPAEAVARFRGPAARPDWFSEAIEPTHPVEDGDRIPLNSGRSLEVIYTPGHQSNHLCLRDTRTGRLFSGDHVLPRISPFIPYTGDGQNHLGAYLASLERIAAIEAMDTYPGHGPTIERGSARAHQILLHHQRRLETMFQELIDGPRSAWQVMQAVFRPNLSPLEERLAFQETMAHLEHLRGIGRVIRSRKEGVWKYSVVGS